MKMINNHYENEIRIDGIVGIDMSNEEDCKKIQEWLNIWRFISTGAAWIYKVEVDGDFGPITERAVMQFQKFIDPNRQGMIVLESDGIVGPLTFAKLCRPMINAFRSDIENDSHGDTLRERIVSIAHVHLYNIPVELFNDNIGPWVRAYMKGKQGRSQYWCQGFVRTILDQAYALSDIDFTEFHADTVSCDRAAEFAIKNGKLLEHKDLLTNGQLDMQVKPGDQFYRYSMKNGKKDWNHTGVIIGVQGTLLECIEGNTNDEGSRNGYEVCLRHRDITKQRLDIVMPNVNE